MRSIGFLVVIFCVVVSADGASQSQNSVDDEDEDYVQLAISTLEDDHSPLEQQLKKISTPNHDHDNDYFIQQAIDALGENDNHPQRQLQKSPNPEDHYFCGRGFSDAAKACEHPCPSGSLEE